MFIFNDKLYPKLKSWLFHSCWEALELNDVILLFKLIFFNSDVNKPWTFLSYLLGSAILTQQLFSYFPRLLLAKMNDQFYA